MLIFIIIIIIIVVYSMNKAQKFILRLIYKDKESVFYVFDALYGISYATLAVLEGSKFYHPAFYTVNKCVKF